MLVGNARLKTSRFRPASAACSCGVAFLIFLFGSKALQNAVAEGETRTISLHHVHTGEDLTITYKRDGKYVEAALDKINWLLRDWRRGEQTRMDPHLIDLVWEVERETGTKQPVYVICGYRSPKTNAMLRRRSHGVARFSQHMLGHAIDFYIPGVPLQELRVIGLRLQRGGVGFYPTSGSPFVHMDTGGVRMWPRMSRNELLHVFPDGRTAYLPSDGKPLSGYALALADLRKRGKNPAQTWSEEAEDAGVSAAQVLSGGERQHTRLPGPAKPGLDPTPAATVVASAGLPTSTAGAASPPPRPTNPMLAALQREAHRKREAARIAAAERATQGTDLIDSAAFRPVLYQTAAFESRPAPAPHRGVEPAQGETHMSPRQVIAARGDWEGQPAPAAAPAQPNPARTSAHPAHREVAAAAPAITASLGPWPNPVQDRVPPELALSYAAQPDGAAVAGANVHPVVARASVPLPPATTIIVKQEAGQPGATAPAAAPRIAATTLLGRRLDNPWLSALVISPSVRRYLTSLILGAQDFRTLAPLVQKPASSVVMTFSADPTPGLTHDRFSGSAVVFVSTVSYQTHTASLH